MLAPSPICPVCDWEVEVGGVRRGGGGHWFLSKDMSAVLSSSLLGVGGEGLREETC